jgi:hypothetical protein
MGKASSNKKVARAAGIGGGRSHRRNTPWGYFAIIAVIVVLGLVGTVTSRDHRLAEIRKAGTGIPPTVGTKWYEGYAVYECGKFLPPISSANSPEGIHTTKPGDGIIYIAPTVKDSAGKNATLGKFASAVGMKLNAAELQVPGGKLYLDGDSCEGKPGHVYVMHFAYPGAPGQLYNGDTKPKNGKPAQLPKLNPTDVPLGDQEFVTIAFVPADDASKIPQPPASVAKALALLGQSSSTTTTTVPATKPATTTVPATTSPTTTVAPKSSTTVKG